MEEQMQVIERLVQQAYGATGDARAEANSMLLVFQSSKEAWQISPRLFNSSVMEVQFFGAHTLYTKIRTEWEQLTEDEKNSVRGVILQLLRHLLAQGHRLVVSRLALALSAIALRSVLRGHWPNMVADVISLNSLDPTGQLTSDILAQIPDELDSIAISETRKEDLCSTLREDAEKVIGHVQWVIQQPQGAKTKALGALKSWVRLNLPPALVFSDSVFGMLFSTLANAELFFATVAVLVELLAQPLDSAVLRGALQAVLQLKSMYEQGANGNSNVSICEGLCRLAASVGEHNADLIVSMQGQEGKALVAFILECVKHPEKATVAKWALGFWAQLERDLIGAQPAQVADFVPAYGALLQVLVEQCRCNPDPDDSDAQDLEDFRHEAMGPLQSCYQLLGSKFFEFLVQSLQASQPPDWVLVESILFMTRAVAPAINTQLKRGSFDAKASPLLKQISGYFLRFASENQSADSRLLETGVVMLGEYAAWLKSDTELLRAVLQFICFRLARDSPCPAAARAFKQVCNEGKEVVLPQLGDLVNLWTTQGALHKLTKKNRVLVVEGIMTAGQAVPPQQIAALLSALSAPVSARLKALIQSQLAKAELSQGVVAELHILNSLFKCLMNTKSAPSDAALPMLRDVWPCLELLAKAGLSDEDTTKALCDCFVSLLMSAKLGSAELLSPLITLVVNGFVQTHFSCLLDVVKTTIQIFGSTKEFADTLASILQTVSQAAFAFLQKDIAAHPDVVCAYFEMLNQALRFAPQAVAPLLATSFSLALVSLNFPDRDTTRAVVSFLNTLASNGTADVLFKGSADQLLAALVGSIVKTINHSLIQYQGELLFHLINRVYAGDEAVRGCVGRCVAAIDSPFLPDDDKKRLLGLLWRVRTKRRFTAMIADLGHVLAGEMTSDVLLSYEM